MVSFFNEVDVRGWNLALDLDDTQIDTTPRIHQFLAGRGHLHAFADLTHDMAELYFAGDRQRWHAECEEFYQNYRPQPLSGFPEFIMEWLRADGKPPLIVSARPGRHYEYAAEHCRMIYRDLGLEVPELICCGREEHSPMAGDCKSAICQRHGVDILIDDAPPHIRGTNQAGLAGILFGDYPWSQSSTIDDASRLHRWDPHRVIEALRWAQHRLPTVS